MADISPSSRPCGVRSAAFVVVALALVACSGSLDIDPSTIGGAEPEDLVGDGPGPGEGPSTARDGDGGDDVGGEGDDVGGDDVEGDDVEVARPDDVDALGIRDVDDPWYLADGPARAAVGERVEQRLASLDQPAICAYMDRAIGPFARTRLLVPAADVAYAPDDPAAASRLTRRAVLDLLDEELDVGDLRVASSLTEACDLRIDLERTRIAARGSLARTLDLPGRVGVDPRDVGWSDRAAGSATDDGPGRAVGPGTDDASDREAGSPAEGDASDREPGAFAEGDASAAGGLPAADAGPREAAVITVWREQLRPRRAELCAWAAAPPRPGDLDAVLARLVQLRAGQAHDGLPSATEALPAACPALGALDWSTPAGADSGDPAGDGARGSGGDGAESVVPVEPNGS